MAISNPWRAATLSPERAILLALSPDPKPLAVLAATAGVLESDALEALTFLQREHLAIAEDDGYELTGPLSWFGDFASAIAYFARRNFVVAATGESVSHLYVCDVRVKGARPAGDPRTETASVFACGKTVRDVASADDRTPTCADCGNIGRP